MKKYTAKVHVNANKENVKFIGEVKADTIKELKEKARKLARNQNERGGRLHLELWQHLNL